MRNIAIPLLLLFAMANGVAAADNVIITQILYNPLATDSGGEAVELYNPTASAIDISGWVVSTETSPTDATIPEGTVIGSKGYYLVADTGWSGSRDDLSWPLADYEEAITLANSDAGAALSNGTSVIDAVGWGSPSGIGSGLYEGAPHSGSGNGESLQRIKNGSSYVDTEDNADDFAATTPAFHNSSYGAIQNNVLSVLAVVEGAFPVISSFAVITDDDSFIGGSQVNPVPKQNKTVRVEAVVSHSSGNSYVSTVTMLFSSNSYEAVATPINSTASMYSFSLNMSYTEAASNYTVQVEAIDLGGFSANATASFEYTELVAMEVDASTLQFSALPGMKSEIAGDYDTSTRSNATIKNIGNSLLDVQLSGTNLTSGSSTISAASIQYAFDGNYNSSMAGTLSELPAVKQLAMESASTMPIWFRLNVPTATMPGNYTGAITLVAVKS